MENGAPTAWVPQSKPIRFTELGCPAIDRGTNQPNVSFDPRSSETYTPHFSRGWRDGAIQRAYLEASYMAPVNEAIIVPLAQHQFDALVSFDFNTGGIFRAKLTAAINAGDPDAARHFMGWLRPPEIR